MLLIIVCVYGTVQDLQVARILIETDREDLGKIHLHTEDMGAEEVVHDGHQIGPIGMLYKSHV
jgi:hypothetical protein